MLIILVISFPTYIQLKKLIKKIFHALNCIWILIQCSLLFGYSLCMFRDIQPEDLMIAVAGDSIWYNKAACGRSYLVTCIKATNQAPEACKEGEIIVTIVDRCHRCPVTINLSQEAFVKIANINAGKIMIKYEP